MKKHLLTLATVLFAAGALFTSCANNPEEPQIQPDGTQISTRAYTQDWEFISSGFELAKDDVPAYQPTYTGN